MNVQTGGTLVKARRLSKSFGGRRALISADLDLRRGEIRGLVGQNGSGKSTLIKILSGFHTPDGHGSLEVDGAVAPLPLTPERASELGFAFVHQDLGLFEGGTVTENLRVGQYATSFGWRISWRAEREMTRTLLNRFDLAIDPDTPVSELSEVERAMVAIVRAVHRMPDDQTGLLVLDEPTAYLPHRNVDQLFAAMRTTASLGHAVIFVSHRLDEIQQITDTVTVLRDGIVVATVPTHSVTEGRLVEMILGVAMDTYYPSHVTSAVNQAPVVLRLRDVSGPGITNFEFQARAGEIVGLTGLLGMPHEQLPYACFGAEKRFGGWVEVGDRTRSMDDLTPRVAIEMGIALLPGNRLRDGGLADATVGENVTLATLSRHFRGGVLHTRSDRAAAVSMLNEFHVVPPEPSYRFGSLSGGNQQKTLVAKWFATEPRVFLMHEPTHGVDVGAKRQVLEQIQRAAREGALIVVASAEYEDLAHMCDRVVVFRRRAGPVELSGDALTKERIIEQCYR